MTWVVDLDGEKVHVRPFDDFREHESDPDCWCHPFNDEGIWVHRSMDGREEYEQGRKPS